HAGVAPVIHVEPIGRNKRLETDLIDIMPMPHDFEAAEEIDVFALCGRGDQRDHPLGLGLSDDLWRELRIDQDDIDDDRTNLCQATADQSIVPAKQVPANYGIGSKLPQYEIGLFRDDSGIEATEHVGNFLAADATVEHGERHLREMLLELDRKPAWIVSGRRTRTVARRRR